MDKTMKVGQVGYFWYPWHGYTRQIITGVCVNKVFGVTYTYDNKFNVTAANAGASIEELADNMRQYVIDEFAREARVDEAHEAFMKG